MRLKSIWYNTITFNLPKSTTQFLLGIILFWVIFGFIDVNLVILALIAFILSYSSVYLFNDLVDYRKDRKDRDKIEWKFIAKGDLHKRTALILCVLFASSGLLLSVTINKWFFIIIASLLFLNLLHSTKLKSRISLRAINITIIQFLKYSCAWFALTANISKFPFWVILSFSIIYVAVYIFYKSKAKINIIKSNKHVLISLAGVFIVSYIISLFIYNFPLALILAFLFFIPLPIIGSKYKTRLISGPGITFLCIIQLTVVLSFILLMSPAIAETNDYLSNKIEVYKEKISAVLPSDIINDYEKISETLEKYKTLDDVERKINQTLNLTIAI